MNNINTSFNNLPPVSAKQTTSKMQMSDANRAGIIASVVGIWFTIILGIIAILACIFLMLYRSALPPEIEQPPLVINPWYIVGIIMAAIFLIIAPIITFIFCAITLKNPTEKNLFITGILGLLFGGIVGGIIILSSNN